MKVVVTGGGGFVGSGLCRRLRDLGHDVTALGRRPAAALAAEGIRTVIQDLSAPQAEAALARLFSGAECVFHTAAHVKMWGPREAFVRGNLVATRNVITACRAAGVAKLVFTSSPSVVATDHDLRGIDESQPYPATYKALYPETKAAAEREVLAAHGHDLKTLALRPHLIFGPGDTNLVPTILQRARAGRLVQVGDGANLVDLTFIADCVSAHVRAAEALDTRPTAGGRAGVITSALSGPEGLEGLALVRRQALAEPHLVVGSEIHLQISVPAGFTPPPVGAGGAGGGSRGGGGSATQPAQSA